MSASDPRRPADPNHPPTPSQAVSLPEVDFGAEGVIDVGELKADNEVVDFNALPEPPSGQSLTSWTAVIKRKQLEADGVHAPQPVKVDAPSDRDLLDRL